MPFKGFRHDNGIKEPIEEALENAKAYGLPRGILRGLALFNQKTQTSDVTITQLLAPVQQTILKQRHEFYQKPDDMVWALVGKALHKVAEEGAGNTDLAEEKLQIDIDGIKVSGTADLYSEDDGGTIIDFKMTSVFGVRDGIKPEWEQQLNCYAALYRNAGFPVKRLQIIAILRDHRSWEMGRIKWEYPESPIWIGDVKLWRKDEQLKFIKDRLWLWRKDREEEDKDLTHCTKEEIWNGKRCEKWCPVNEFCHQYQRTASVINEKGSK